MKKQLLLFFVIGTFILAQAQTTKTDTTAERKFGAGIKANGFLMLIPNDNDGTILTGVDCSVYLQYGVVGILGGLTPIFNSTLLGADKQVVPFINLGIFLKLANFTPTDALYLYLYNLQGSQLLLNYVMKPPGSSNYVFYPYYKHTEDVVVLSPRYHATLVKNVAALELGVFFGVMQSTVYYDASKATPKTEILPCFGTNLSLSFNIAGLFGKK